MKRLILGLLLLIPLFANADHSLDPVTPRDFEVARDWKQNISRNVEFDACRGALPYYSCEFKFGDNEDVGTTFETLWGSNIGVNNYFPPTAQQIKFTSTSALDTAAGTGAQTIRVTYLDSAGLEGEEDITLDGQTEATSVASMLRINRIEVTSVGVLGSNAGYLYAFIGTSTAGVPDDLTQIVNAVTLLHNQTTSAFYTVPSDKRAHVILAYSGVAANKTGTFLWRIDTGTGVFRVAIDYDLTNQFIDLQFAGPLLVPPGTDLRVVVKLDTGSGRASAGFRAILLDEDTP